MKAYLLVLIIFLLGTIYLNAQPCDFPPSSLDCEDAPVICNIYDLDGYCTSLPDFPNPSGPMPFCNGIEESKNTIWFGFIGGTKNLSINIKPLKCTTVGGQTGFQCGIYSGDCVKLSPIVCHECSSSMINLSTNNLISGNVYWLVMDGCNGSVCDITVDILSGSEPPVLGNLGPISGPDKACIGSSDIYMFDKVTGAQFYKWSFNGEIIPLGIDTNRIEVNFDSIGIFQLCAETGSGCNVQQQCIDVTVTPGPAGIDPAPVKSCKHSPYLFNGIEYMPGKYKVKLESFQGCDSIVNLTVDTLPDIHNNIGILYRCNNDCLSVQDTFGNGGDPVEKANVVLQSATGCDSIVSFTLRLIDLEVKIDSPYDLDCFVNQTPLDGSSTIDKLANYSQLIIKWTALNGGKLYGPDDQLLTVTEDPGKYCLTVEAVGSDSTTICKDSACVIVNRDPSSPTPTIIGDTISCTKDTIILTGLSSTPGSTYLWTDPNGNTYSGSFIKVTIPGQYNLTVADPGLCISSTPFTVITTYKQKFFIEKDTLLCFGESIQLNKESLTAPGEYSFSNLLNDTCFNFKYNLKLKNTEEILFHICAGESFMLHNTFIDKPGVYEIHSPQASGCDSVYYATVIEDPTNNTNASVNVKMGSIYNGHLILSDTIINEVLKNQFGCDSTVVTTIHVSTSTNNLNSIIEISIVPNPAKHEINISSKQTIELESYEIYNSLGQRMIINSQKPNLPLHIDISSWPVNLYLIKLKMNGGVIIKSFIKVE